VIGGPWRSARIGGGTSTSLAHASSALGLAVDATSLYWYRVNVYGGTVMKVALTGGTPVVLAFGQQEPATIAIDATHVYWTSGGAVMETPK